MLDSPSDAFFLLFFMHWTVQDTGNSASIF